METKDLLKKVRKIEIKTRRLSDHIFSGEYHTSFKGRGMTFSEVRQYQFGDDIRAIDWNVTARYNEPYVKVFEEERELTMMLMVDISGSESFGTKNQLKSEIVTEIAATMAFSATQNNDKIGLILFSDQIELYIPPKKGKSHVLRIIRELIEFEPKSKKTDLSQALKFLSSTQKKKAIAAQPTAPAIYDATLLSNVKYRLLGPFRGGRSGAVAGSYKNKNTFYFGATGGGVWKTEDAGQTWRNISDGYFKTGSVGAVAVSQSDPNVVYAGMGEHAPRGVMTSYGDGVYKSTDAGKTWKHLGLELTRHIANVRIHPQNPDVVYVAAQGALNGPSKERGIYKSEDGGKTWKNVLYVDENTGCSDLSMDMTNPRILYAAMWDHRRLPWAVQSGGKGSGLYKSTDGGETWFKIQQGLPKELGKMGISVSQSNPEKVYALVESDTQKEQGGLFVSGDGGENWSRISKDHRLISRAWYYIWM